MTPPRDELAVLADEYVLGLLDPAEAAAVEARLADDEDLQVEVATARDRLLEFDASESSIELSRDLWNRIEAAISEPAPERARPAKPDRPDEAGRARDRPEQTVHRIDSRRGVNRWWRPAAITGLAASLLLAAGLGWQMLTFQRAAVIAVLLDDAGNPVALVEDYGDDSARVIPLVDIDVPEDRALQVWTLPDPDEGPVSYGILQQNISTTLEGPEDLPPPSPDQLYEITIEEETGSPTGGPTGPIVGKGFARIPR